MSPTAHRSYIYVNKSRLRVVTDAAALHGESRIPHFGSRGAGNSDVDRLGFHVLAVQGHAVAVFA